MVLPYATDRAMSVFRLILDRDFLRPLLFLDAMLLLLIQAAELRRSAHSCLLSCWDLFDSIAQKFDKALDSQFPVGGLAAGLLRYDSKYAILAYAAANAAHNKLFLLRGEAGGVCHVEPERHARAHLVNVLASGSAA